MAVLEQLIQAIGGDMSGYEIMKLHRNVRYGRTACRIRGNHRLEFVNFFFNRRGEEIDKQPDDKRHFKKGDEHRDGPVFETQNPLCHFNDGLEDVGYEAGRAKRQQNVLQVVDKPHEAYQPGQGNQPADDTVECIRTRGHFFELGIRN